MLSQIGAVGMVNYWELTLALVVVVGPLLVAWALLGRQERRQRKTGSGAQRQLPP
jgi:hypothetical protein